MVGDAPEGMSFKQARSWFKDQNDGQLNLMDFNAFWKAYKEDKKSDEKHTLAGDLDASDGKTDYSDVPKDIGDAREDPIEIGEQDHIMYQEHRQTLQEDHGVQPGEDPQPVKQPETRSAPEEYEVLADSIHNTMANFVKFLTKDQVKIEQQDISRLNKNGAVLLRKYDTDGTINQYSPELAYVLALLDIGTRVYVVMKKPQPAAIEGQSEPKKETEVSVYAPPVQR